MPLIGSFGGGSSRGFGRFGKTVKLPTGGTITTAGGYRIHTFTGSGTFNSGDYTSFDLLVVGGGGGRAGSDLYPCTGGGAGGFLSFTNYALAANTNFPVVIGGGGDQGSASYIQRLAFNPPSYGQILSDGGGAGGQGNGTAGGYSGYSAQGYGGSSGGGGGGGYAASDTFSPGGAGRSPGYSGGSGANSTGYSRSVGGGGGAGGAGYGYGVGNAGGGPPLYSSISGISTAYCGGGEGIGPAGTTIPLPGAANTGYGGSRASGGSGVVIVKYLLL